MVDSFYQGIRVIKIAEVKSNQYIMRKCGLLLIICCLSISCFAQLKYIIEDFEGFAQGQTQLQREGLFSYGNIKISAGEEMSLHKGYSGDKAFVVKVEGKEKFGGWGKGLTANVELDQGKDHFNLYLLNPGKDIFQFKVLLQDDDNGDSKFDQNTDDVWEFTFNALPKRDWQLLTMPLKEFKDGNAAGDGSFNISYKHGKLLTVLLTNQDEKEPDTGVLYFDFLCFSKGILPTGATVFDPAPGPANSYCKIGAWSEEGNQAKFVQIASSFESQINSGKKNLDVVHFFYPFSVEQGTVKELYPAVERINEVVKKGYTSMITLENHYLKANKKQGQPNLYTIIEGHHDYFFSEWAKRIKKAEGEVWLRILHEFNGNWYPWSLADNDRNPAIYISAYQRIVNIFKKEGASNVKFIWCPNSMSVPQENWNYIMDSYPGDEYVDFVGIDVYNGAGEEGTPIWRSFRKEAIETYFTLTDKLPHKPLFICETASRERNVSEKKDLQSKADWIKQMSEALKTDMSQVKLVVWFNEYESFKVNSSPQSKEAFTKYIWTDPYFSSPSSTAHSEDK